MPQPTGREKISEYTFGRDGVDGLKGAANEDHLYGKGGNDWLRGLSGDDYLEGGKGQDELDGGDDVIDGGDSNENKLEGFDGDDYLKGYDGEDTLSGGAGDDKLLGGEGADSFVFDTALDVDNNVDTVMDFSTSEDSIVLSNSIFTSLVNEGVLAAEYFHASATGLAAEENDYILYNTGTGSLLLRW